MQICSAIRPAIRSAISAAIVSAFCAPVVAGPLLGQLFPITAPGVTNPGFAIDYSDLTEEKLAWRKNLFNETEFRNGLVDAPTRSTGVTASTIAGYAGAIAFPVSAASEYAYKSASLLQGTMVGFSLVVEMGDDLGPPVIGGNLNGVDASPILGGAVVATGSVQVSALGGRLYLLRVPTLAVPTSTATYGIVRYAGNSTRTLKVTAYMLNLGQLLPYQMLTDVSTEFLLAYPYHLLYRDSLGQVACYALEDLCGLALDAKFGGARGPQLWSNPPTSVPASWTYNGNGSYTHTPGTAVSIGFASGAIPGRTYEVSFLVSGRTAGSIRPYVGSTGAGPVFTAFGRLSARFAATGTNGMYFYADSAFDGTISEILIQEVYGDHVVQATVGDRPAISAKYNQLANSAWQGGGAIPVGWTQPGASGVSAALAPVNGNVPYRFTAAAQRPFFAAPNITLAVGQSAVMSVEVASVATGTETVVGAAIIALGSGNGTTTVTVDGVSVPNNTQISTLPVGARIAATLVCTAAGTFQPRVGMGASTNATGEVVLINPMLSPGGPADIPRYQRTNSDGTYDYAGFPIGARCNGINSWMQILASSIAGRGKLVLAVSYRKDADPSVAVDQAIVEIGSIYANGPGRIVLATSVGGNTLMGAYVRGSSSTVGAAIAMPAPSNAVLLTGVDWTTGAPLRAVRRNGAFIGSTPSPLVGGEGAVVDAQAIYIGRRGGTGTSLNGMIYRIFGYGVDFAGRYGQIEGWLNERTKVALA